MARRKDYEKIDINVEPFLSIMAIVLKLISLILVVIVMRIAVNPKARRVLSFANLWAGHTASENPKSPFYIDCHEDRVVLYSDVAAFVNKAATWEDLQKRGNIVDQLLERVQANRETEYVILLVRPKSLKYYRVVKSMIAKREGIDLGCDAMDSDFEINWNAEKKALAIKE